MIKIQIDAPDIQDVKRKLGAFPNRSHVVLSRAVNRTVTNTKVNISKQVRLRYIIKQKTVKNSLSTTKKATSRNPIAVITSTGSPIPLINFDVTPRKRMKKLKGGRFTPNIYQSRVLKDSGLKGVKRMFIAKNQVLVRPEYSTREENNNIKDWLRFSLSVPQMINNEKVIDEIKNKAMLKLRERVNHEIQYELRRLQN